jgi:hypothetical protein
MKRTIATLAAVLLLAGPADAQWRRDGGPGWRGGGGFDRPYGGGIGGAVLGGAIVGGMISNYFNPPPVYVAPPIYVQPQVAPPQFNPVAYCVSRFRSYNPATGLYFGFDGAYHPCP